MEEALQAAESMVAKLKAEVETLLDDQGRLRAALQVREGGGYPAG